MVNYFLDSEYLSLKTVLLCNPSFKTGNTYNPKKSLHLKKVDFVAMNEEFKEIIVLFKKFGIKSYLIDPQKMPHTSSRYLLNLMFTRDLFFLTPKGAIVSRMASFVRRGEVKYAQRALKKLGVPIRKVIQGRGAFEGADALWVSPRMIAIGVGNRTNSSGFKQVKEELSGDGIQCVRLPPSSGTPHLLGAVQIIDKNLAMVRMGLVKPQVVSFLRENRIGIIRIPENEEVKNKQAFNFVTVAPRKIIMPAACPRTKEIFQKHGVEVLADVFITQLINAGGGLACATGILARGLD
jgi:N-dimethylarginine dimethylaminohydrolase